MTSLVRSGNVASGQSAGMAIEDILLLAESMSEEEIRNQIVIALPFRG